MQKKLKRRSFSGDDYGSYQVEVGDWEWIYKDQQGKVAFFLELGTDEFDIILFKKFDSDGKELGREFYELAFERVMAHLDRLEFRVKVLDSENSDPDAEAKQIEHRKRLIAEGAMTSRVITPEESKAILKANVRRFRSRTVVGRIKNFFSRK